MDDFATRSAQASIPPTPAEVDNLLLSISQAMGQNTLDPSDQLQLQQLVECLGDSRGMTRLRVAETLGQIGQPAIPVLETALAHHHNPVVRRASAKTLTLIADPLSIPTLIQALLTDEDTVVKGSSVAALARIGEAAVPELLAILESPEHPASIKGHAAWALAFIGTEAQDYLDKALRSNIPEVRAAVIGALAKVVQEEPSQLGLETERLKSLVQALDDEAAMVRCEAAAALGNCAYPPAVPRLINLLHHPDWETRKAVALALMKMGDCQALSPLRAACLEESDTAVQKVLRLAISQLEKTMEG